MVQLVLVLFAGWCAQFYPSLIMLVQEGVCLRDGVVPTSGDGNCYGRMQ
jgi:hypothetical protein